MSKGGAFKATRVGKGLLPPSMVVGRIGDVRDEGCPLSQSSVPGSWGGIIWGVEGIPAAF